MKYKIADLIVELTPFYDLTKDRIKAYEYVGDRVPDIVFTVSEQYYIDRHKENPQLTLAECEYVWGGAFFYERLTTFGGVLLHSSCVEYEGKAYLFSAPSGTGKSTHTHLWLEHFPGARIINDDKPAIRKVNGVYRAYGTPWSGKNDESVNEGVPIAGIAFLSRGKENEIKRISGVQALKNFLDQTIRPHNKEYAGKMLEVLDGVLTDVPVFALACDMSEEAVRTSYNAMNREVEV